MRKQTPPLPNSPLFPMACFYLLFSALAFYPCLLLGQAYFDNDLLAYFGPARAFLRDQLAQGHFPLWNPFLLGGQPFFADLQSMMFYPLNYPTLLFPVAYGFGVFFFLHMFLAGLGMHLWLKTLGLSEKACATGALLFSNSGFFWLELIHPPVLAAFAWLPWVFAGFEWLAQKKEGRAAFFAGLAFAMLFLCGSFQVTLGALYGGGFYFLGRVWILRGNKEKSVSSAAARPWKWSLLFLFLWGAFPLLGQFIPTQEFSALTSRRAPAKVESNLSSNLSLSPKDLYQLALPRLGLGKGDPSPELLQSTDPQKNLWGWFGYLGAWPFLLAFWAFRGKNRHWALLLSVLYVLGLAACLGKNFFVYQTFCALLPGFNLIRVPFRYIYLCPLALSALAATGFEAWSRENNDVHSKRWLWEALWFSLFLYLIALWSPIQDWREIAALGLGLGAFFIQVSSPKKFPRAQALLQAALVFPLLLSGWACFKTGPSSNFDYLKKTGPLGKLAQKIHPLRVIFDTPGIFYPLQTPSGKFAVNFPQNASYTLGFKNFGGYNPLALESVQEINSMNLESLIHLGAIAGILTQTDHGLIPNFTLESIPPYKFYRYKKPLSLAYAPAETQTIEDKTQRLEFLHQPGFDSTRQALFSETFFPSPTPVFGAPGVQLQCSLKEDETDRQLFNVDLNRDRWVVFTEIMFPGWKAKVDGEPANILTADNFLRAVYIKSGKHQVEFDFQPYWWPWVPIGLAVWIALTLLGFALGSIIK